MGKGKFISEKKKQLSDMDTLPEKDPRDRY